MPTKNPRVNVVLERPLYDALGRLARREGSSLSTKARDLIRGALETYEDLALAKVAEERERTLVRSAALTHDEVRRGGRGKYICESYGLCFSHDVCSDDMNHIFIILLR